MIETCKDEEEWQAMRAQMEIPPKGYTGSLVGTVWDPAAIAATYGSEGW